MSSYLTSIVVQGVSLLYATIALIANNKGGGLLRQSLWLEIIVNVVQLAWYIAAPYIFVKQPMLSFLARARRIHPVYRYIDWVVTTNLMLLSMIALGSYLSDAAEDSLWSLVSNKAGVVFSILMANTTMLLFGFLAERFTSERDRIRGPLLLAGFFPFVEAWVLVVWKSTPHATVYTYLLYISTGLVWAMYGVFSHTNARVKTMAYNILDMIAKNVYSIVITTIIIVQ